MIIRTDKIQLQRFLDTQNVSIPEKFSDIQLNFTREQKSKIYDFVIANTTKSSEPELSFSFDDAENPMTLAEITTKTRKKYIKLQRKYKTTKPTHIENIRNLVQLQMQAFNEYLNPEANQKMNNKITNYEIRNERGKSRSPTKSHEYNKEYISRKGRRSKNKRKDISRVRS